MFLLYSVSSLASSSRSIQFLRAYYFATRINFLKQPTKVYKFNKAKPIYALKAINAEKTIKGFFEATTILHDEVHASVVYRKMPKISPSMYKPPGAYTWKFPSNAKLNKAKMPQEQNFIYIQKNYYVYQMSIKFTVSKVHASLFAWMFSAHRQRTCGKLYSATLHPNYFWCSSLFTCYLCNDRMNCSIF